MKIIKYIFLILTLYATERFCHKQTKGFQLYKITPWNTIDPKWHTDPIEPSVLTYIDQPFYFLGSGGQCYAFVSQDNTYVIKFFKLHHMRPLPSFMDTLYPPLSSSHQERKEHIFGSCLIVDKHFKEYTGTLYVHINPTTTLNKQLTIIDNLGIAHTIDLDSTPFIVQKKADLAYPTLKKLLKSHQYDKARVCIRSLLSLIQSRSDKGIADKDPIIKRNFGFIETQAVEIDIGSYSLNPYLKKSYASKRNLLYEIEQLERWLRKRDPKGQAILQEELSQLISNP